LGRKASPIAQGRLKMDAIVVGIDVSKDKLDIAVLPQGQTFAISRDAKGLEGLAMHSPGH
jgi:transposase